MEISIAEAARLLNRSPRAVRYLVTQGQLPARRVGRALLIRVEELPLTEAQRREAEKTWGRVREVVDRTLQPSPATGVAPAPTAAAPSAAGAPRTYSLRTLRAFTTGIELFAALPAAPAGLDVCVPVDRLDPAEAVQTGLEELADAFYQYDPRRKRERLEEARRSFSRALTRLFALRQLLAEPAPPETGTASGVSSDARRALLTRVDQAIAGLEADVMAGVTGLLRRLDGDRRGGGRAMRAEEGGS